MCVRTEGGLIHLRIRLVDVVCIFREYLVQIDVESMLPDSSYHASFQTPPDTWITVRIPFSSFRAVYMGYPREVQRHLDHFQVKSIGLMIADRNPGAFRLDMQQAIALPAQS